MSSMRFPGRPFGSGDLPWPIALFDTGLEPPDPLFDALEQEMPARGRSRGRGGPQGAPALAEKPRPRPPAPGKSKPAPTAVAPLVLLALSAALLGACGEDDPFAVHTSDAVLVQLKSADAKLAHQIVDEGGPPIVALASLGAEGEAPLLRMRVAPGQTPEALARELSQEDDVAFAEPVYLYQSQGTPSGSQRTPNDPRMKDLWGLSKIDLPAAWSKTVGDRSVAVAVVDDGVALAHPDLAANLWVNPEEIAENGKDDDGDGYVDDVNGYDFVDNDADPNPAPGGPERFHGTHVAGIVGAVGDNGIGVAGVNWKVSLMALRAIGPQGGRADDLARAIDYATDHGARVINASWGGGGQSRVIANAIGRARAHGLLFIAAAGNDGGAAPVFPANLALDNLISVGASGPDDKLAAFSNRGALVAAPGVGILSTTAPGQYERYDGTSMAAPHVAGLAALLWAAEPAASLAQVRDAILASAVALDGTDHGRIDAGRALAALEGGGSGGGFKLSRSALAFKIAKGKVPRAQTVSLRVEGGGARRWSATADAAFIKLPRSSGTTPSRLSVKIDPAGLADGAHVGHVHIAAEGAKAAAGVSLTVSVQVGASSAALAQGAACEQRAGAIHVKAGTVCALSAPGFDAQPGLATVAWHLPGGEVATGARLYGRFVRKGSFHLRVDATDGEPEDVPIVIE